MSNTNEFFDLWLKAQNQALEATKAVSEQMQTYINNGTKTTSNPFEFWQNSALDAFTNTQNKEKIFKDVLVKTFSNSKTYQKLYEIWQPYFKAIQNKSLNTNNYKNFLDPLEIKKLVDDLFNFDADYFNELQSQLKKFSTNAEQMTKPWMDATQKNINLFPEFIDGQPESFQQMFQNIHTAFDKTFVKNMHAPAVGKDREKVELMLKFIDDLSIYTSKNAEFQHAMYVTGLSATEKVIEAIAQKIEQDEENIQFEDFFNLWIDTNEKTYYSLFQTKEYSVLKGDLVQAGLNARKKYFELTETYLSDLPIALRSEMNDLYKTVYELRKRIKLLEKQIKEQKA
jgi:class III poly(R)-hydroxyalkanoic acid synthase PhaE subunit